MPIKGTRFLLTRKGDLAMDVLKLVIRYIGPRIDEEKAKAEVVEVLDWIAGEVVKEAEC